MKKLAFNYLQVARFFIAAAVVIFLLEGCCLIPGFEGTKKPCNCKDDPAYANKNKSQPQPAISSELLSITSKSNSAVGKNEIQPNDLTLQYIPASYIKMEEILIPHKIPYKAAEKKLPLGIKGITTSIIAGPTISFKSSKEDYGNSNHKHKPGAGVVLGIGTTNYFSEKFAVKTSLLFKSNNASEELSYTIPGEPGGGSSSETKTKYSYSYLSAPVLAQFKLSDQLTAIVGPEINYLLGASTKTSGYGEKNKITDNSVKVGIGAQAGLRYDFPGTPLGIQLMYDQRISRLNKKTETMDYVPGGGGSSYETPAWNMKSIQVGVTCALCDLMKKK